MRTAIAVIVCFTALNCRSLTCAEGTLETAAVVESVVASEKRSLAYKTLFLESVWHFTKPDSQEFQHTILKQNETGQTYYRVERGSGSWAEDAEIESWEEWITDGEVVAQYKSGKSLLPAEAQRVAMKEIDSLLTINIFEGSRRIPIRHSLKYAALTPAYEHNEKFTATPAPSTPEGVPCVSLEWFLRNDTGQKYQAICELGDLNRVRQETYFNPAGGAYCKKWLSYLEVAPFISVPETISIELPNARMMADDSGDSPGDAVVRQEYNLLEIRFNDPVDFPAGTFSVFIPEGSHVWDKRHQVDYIAGRDPAANLDEVAQAAKARQVRTGVDDLGDFGEQLHQLSTWSAREAQIPIPATLRTRWQFLLILTNLVGILLILSATVYKARKKRS